MSNLPDAEEGRSKAVAPELEGFAAAAEWLAQDGDDETLIFRKFGEISARNLLYLQCEILLLRKKLQAHDQLAAKDDVDMTLKEAARRWETLAELTEKGGANAIEHMVLIKELRAKMREYCARHKPPPPEVDHPPLVDHLPPTLPPTFRLQLHSQF